LQRKLDRLRVGEVVRGGSSRAIVAVNSAPSVAVRCIQVDSPSHLYLCSRSYIPTHNTTALNDIICRIIKEYGVRAAFASFEQDPQRDHRRALRSWFWEEFEPKLNNYQREQADQWIEDHFRFMVADEDDDGLGTIIGMSAKDARADIARAVLKMSPGALAGFATVARELAAGMTVQVKTAAPDPIVLRQGKVISAANEKKLREAHEHMNSAVECIKSVVDPTDDETSEGDTTGADDEAKAARARKAAAMKRKLTVV
jgi:hypothetical protein